MKKWLSHIKRSQILILIFVLSFVVRTLVSLSVDPAQWPDSKAYISLAKSLAAGKGYVYDSYFSNPPEYRAPLYAFLIALVYKTAGERNFLVQLLQSLFGSIVCLLVYGIGKRLFDESAGLVAAFFVSIYPFSVYLASVLLSEQIFVLFLLLGLYFLVCGKKSLNYFLISVAGICLGLGALARPEMLIFILASGTHLLFHREFCFPRRLAAVLLLVFFSLLAISPWTIRNYIQHDEFILISTAGGKNFWQGNNSRAGATDTSVVLAGEPKEILELMNTSPSPKTIENAYWSLAFNWIKQNPGKFLYLYLRKFVNFWRVTPDNITYVQNQKLVNVFSACMLIPLYIFSLLGIVKNRSRWREYLLLYLAILSFPFGLSFFVTSFRFRMPLDSLLILLAAKGLLWIVLWRRDRIAPNS
jgi:4-amino-4-deoxy-L-arabinose transferase-like glycosyltransferase